MNGHFNLPLHCSVKLLIEFRGMKGTEREKMLKSDFLLEALVIIGLLNCGDKIEHGWLSWLKESR